MHSKILSSDDYLYTLFCGKKIPTNFSSPPFKKNNSYFSLIGLLTKYNEKHKVIYYLIFIFIFYIIRINQTKISKFSLFRLFKKNRPLPNLNKKIPMECLFPIKKSNNKRFIKFDYNYLKS